MSNLEFFTCPACNKEFNVNEFEKAKRKQAKRTYIDLICPNCEAYIEAYDFIEE